MNKKLLSQLEEKLSYGTLIKRYKRFLADIKLDSGETITAHCPNSGSMTGCSEPGSKVIVSKSNNPKRKLAYTWEFVYSETSSICVQTHRANDFAVQILENGLIKELEPPFNLKREVKLGKKSRIDIVIEKDNKTTFIEVKSVTLAHNNVAMFPDAVTTRGQRHLLELENAVADGYNAAMFFLIQRSDCKTFAPAKHIDPEYSKLFYQVSKKGVKTFAYSIGFTEPNFIYAGERIPILEESQLELLMENV